MKKLVISVIFGILSLSQISAEDTYVIQIQPGKKVMHASNVELPQTTTLGELLTFFPELLARDASSRIENYDLQIEDVSIGSSREAVLENILLCDIKDIEVSENPGTSQQKNGQGGVINVKLAQSAEGLSGRAHVIVSSLFGAIPTARLNYHKDNLDIRASLILEYYSPVNDIEETYTREADKVTSAKIDTCHSKKGSQLFNFHMKYCPDSKNTLKVWLREGFTVSKYDHYIARDLYATPSHAEDLSKNRDFNLHTGVNYEYNDSKWGFEAQAEYTLNPQYYHSNKYEVLVEESRNYYDRVITNTVSAYAKGKYRFVPTTDRQKSELVFGCNSTINPSGFNYDFDGSDKPLKKTLFTFQAKGNTLYLSPFVEYNSIFGPFFLKGGLRYQHYHYMIDTVDDIDNLFKTQRNDLTAFVNFGWQVAPHHHLSLILDRSIRRPESGQIYPYTIYDPSSQIYRHGNSELQSSSIHTASLNYITDVQFSSGHSIIVDISGEYINGRKLIETVDKSVFETYMNNKKSDIANANASIIYSCGVFSVACIANMFQNWTQTDGVKDSYFYYNVSLTPMLQFNNGWGISTQFTYNSHIRTKQSTLSDYFLSNVRFNKTWKDFIFFIDIYDNFHKYAEDKIYGLENVTHYFYNLHNPFMTIGASFRF